MTFCPFHFLVVPVGHLEVFVLSKDKCSSRSGAVSNFLRTNSGPRTVLTCLSVFEVYECVQVRVCLVVRVTGWHCVHFCRRLEGGALGVSETVWHGTSRFRWGLDKTDSSRDPRDRGVICTSSVRLVGRRAMAAV